MDEAERLNLANEFLGVVAGCGRHFFHHESNVAQLKLDARKRVWFIDHWTGKRVYTHGQYLGRGFTGGGTLNCLIVRLRQYIKDGKQLVIPAEKHWGYGDDMAQVLTKKDQLNQALQSQPDGETDQLNLKEHDPK